MRMPDRLYVGIILLILAILMYAVVIVLLIHRRKGSDFLTRTENKLRNHIAQNQSGLSYGMYLTLLIACPVLLGGAMLLLTQRIALAIILMFAGASVPELLLQFRKQQAKKQFEGRYYKCLVQLSSSLRAGMTIEQAVDGLCESNFIDPSMRAEFQRVKTDLGTDKTSDGVRKAFEGFAERTGSEDAKDVASALAIQNIVGGQEAKVVAVLAKNLSDRSMTRREVSMIFANASMTVLGMDIIPIAIVIMLHVTSPDYFKAFFESLPLQLTYYFLWVLILIGSFFTHQMINKVKRLI